MSMINKVLCDRPQSFSEDEKAQGRANIGAQASIAFSYSGSTITGIDGSAVGTPGALTGIDHDYNLTGSGTSSVPLGLADPVLFSAQSGSVNPVSSVTLGHSGLLAVVPSSYTAQVGMSFHKATYEYPSALDPNGSGLTSHGYLDFNSVEVSSHDCSYITHNYARMHVDAGLGLYQGYGSGSNQSAVEISVSGQTAGPTMHMQQGTAHEYVDIPSIRRWNAKLDASASSQFLTGVSSNKCVTGDGSSGSPIGLSAQISAASSLSTASATSYFNGFGLDGTADPYTSCRYRVGGWSLYTNGDATHHHEVAANPSGIGLSWNTNYYWSNIHASGINQKDAWSPSRNSAEWAYTGATLKYYEGRSAIFQTTGLTLYDSASGSGRTVSINDIDRWNTMSAGNWAESANPLSTGFGGNPVTAASVFPSGAGNIVVRRVKVSGLPDQDMIGFGSTPSNPANLVGSNGQWVAYQPGYSAIYLTSNEVTYDTAYLPTGVTWNMRVDVWNVSDHVVNIKTDTFHGSTSDLNIGESATIWYVPSLSRWTDFVNSF